ncbi:MAG: right-handed parallel beta-helix repeat-containing protein [Planctomycetota bacterium]
MAVSAGYWHSLAADTDGTIWSWGKNNKGQLAVGHVTNKETPQPVPVVRNITQGGTYYRIQRAIDEANNSDVIVASRGTYAESIDFLHKSLSVRSSEPNDVSVVESTMLDAPDKNSAVTFSDNPNSALAGLTILKAKYGIKCNNSSPRISRCIIQDQKYHGLRCTNSSSPTIVDCNIQNNGPSPGDVGHGVFSDDSHPAIVRCVVTGNDHGVESTSSSSLTVANSSVPDHRRRLERDRHRRYGRRRILLERRRSES